MKSSPIPATFRANAGLVVLNARGEVLAAERGDRPGAWQLPQGGIDAGEEPEAAAWRELAEETGLTSRDVVLVAEHPEWLAYVLPPEYRSAKTGLGQAQKWFAFRLTAQGARRFRPGPRPEGDELRTLAFMPFAAVARRIPPFRKPVYARLRKWLRTVTKR